MRRKLNFVTLAALALAAYANILCAAETKPAWQLEWEKTVEGAKKEGKLVAALPASAELRKAIGEVFPKRFPGIELDLTRLHATVGEAKIGWKEGIRRMLEVRAPEVLRR